MKTFIKLTGAAALLLVLFAACSNPFWPGKDKQINPIDQPENPKDLSGSITITPNTNVIIGMELTAVYSGNETVSYQWKKDGTNVGTNSDKYTPTQEGSYTVTVSAEGYHSKTSAVVDVNDPSLLFLSGTITITPNTDVTIGTELTAVYNGSETVKYHWEKDGESVGTNSNKFTPTEAGSYTVTVSAEGYNHKTSAAVVVSNPAPKEYTIEIDMIDNETGDTVTVSPNKGIEGNKVTLSYTVANTAHYNQLDFGGIDAHIASVESAGSGERTYTIHAADSSNGVITITAIFTHTDLEIDHIAFSEHNEEHITKTYGDAPFTNPITDAHKGKGAITYHSNNESVATVNDSGQVTILKAGSAVISAEKAADTQYAHAQTTYTLTVNRKPVTITGLSAADKYWDTTAAATVTGTAVISGKVGSDTVTAVAGTASFANRIVGTGKTVSFSGWSLGGTDAANYTLSAQPASVTAAINHIPVEMVQIPAGTFTMGSPNTETGSNNSERPQHSVTMSGFSMSIYEVTQEQYTAIMDINSNVPITTTNPSFWKTNAAAGEIQWKRPVEYLSWYTALVFCNRLSMTEGLSPAYSINGSTNPVVWGNVPSFSPNTTWDAVTIVAGSNGYRLPTESQWEYACRAGTTTTYHTGDTISDNTGWYTSNSGNKSHQVGLKPANAWGLYDMHGNVQEWCWDWISDDYSDRENETDPTGLETAIPDKESRVFRGGHYNAPDSEMRSAYRTGTFPEVGSLLVGLRLVRPLPVLPGNISISPNSGVYTDMELTATYSGSESVSYQWKKDGVNVGGNSNKYTPIEAGSYTVTVSAAGYTSKTSAVVAVEAGLPEPPPAPEGMVYVPPGTFQLGYSLGTNPGTHANNYHSVTLTKGFFMSKYEVTQELYEEVMGTNPSSAKTGAATGETQGKRPVEYVTWYDAVEFCNNLSTKDGLTPVYTITNRTPSTGYPITNATVTVNWDNKGYRLPTEAEWEYAAKGGHQGASGWVGYSYAGSDTVGNVAWYSSNSNTGAYSTRTHEVGKKAPNFLGLYDMSGNVHEWVWDYNGSYTNTAKTDPQGPTTGSDRVRRGGGYIGNNIDVRSVSKSYLAPGSRDAEVGFRVVRRIP